MINDRIIAALHRDGMPDAVPDLYDGVAAVYYTFSCHSYGIQYGDGRPTVEAVDVSVHLFAPPRADVTSLRTETRQRLLAAGFSWPDEIDATDADGQHYVYETQCIDMEADCGKA